MLFHASHSITAKSPSRPGNPFEMPAGRGSVAPRRGSDPAPAGLALQHAVRVDRRGTQGLRAVASV